MAKKLLNSAGQTVSSTVASDPAADLWSESVNIATTAAESKKAYQLTQAEKFAVCVAAGAHLRYDGAAMKTVHPCKVTDKPTGGFTVTQVTPPPVEETGRVPSQIPPHPSTTISERLLCPKCGFGPLEGLLMHPIIYRCQACGYSCRDGEDSGATANSPST